MDNTYDALAGDNVQDDDDEGDLGDAAKPRSNSTANIGNPPT